MPSATNEPVRDDWPLFGLRVQSSAVVLRPTREEDLPHRGLDPRPIDGGMVRALP